MTSTAVLAQADSVTNWLGVAGQWASACATVFVALKVDQWQRRRGTEERRAREMEQARLVVITVDYTSHSNGENGWVEIANYSELQLERLKIESISDALPPVRWADRVLFVDEDGDEYYIKPDDSLLPRTRPVRVPYQHIDADGRPISMLDDFFNDKIKRVVFVDDVTITFDMSGVQWRRTGKREPVRAGQSAPVQQERLHSLLQARVKPFVADLVNRIVRR
ncbi:MAG: hypothetical protein M3Y48_23310 [Actinomycetota bacterium]|nr:hypothetical protein [Actinomycetota bacterium]